MNEPWIIHAYRFDNQFDDKDKELNQGFAKEDGQYLFHIEGTKEIHLGILPHTHDDVLSAYGIPLQCMRELLAKVTEVIRSEITEAPKQYPGWFTGGLDLLVTEQVLRTRGRLPNQATDDPIISSYYTQVSGLARRTKLPAPLDLILGNTTDLGDRQAGLGYVWANWMLSGKNKKRLNKFITGMLKLPADDGYATQLAKIAKKHFKKGLLKNLDRDFKKYLRSITAPWRFEGPESQIMGDKILQIADERGSASCISHDRPAKPVYKIKGKVTILKDYAKHQANLVVGKRGKNYLIVSLISDRDKKGIFLYQLEDKEWKTLLEFPREDIVPGTQVEFQFEMRKQRHMAFLLNGEEIFDIKFERAMTGSWGLQAETGGSVLWEGVKLINK